MDRVETPGLTSPRPLSGVAGVSSQTELLLTLDTIRRTIECGRSPSQGGRSRHGGRGSEQACESMSSIGMTTITAGNVHYALRRAVAALRAAREAGGLSLADVAQRSGIDRAALSRLENEHNINPKLETLGRYAGALGLEIAITVHDPDK